ncbi:MAG: type I DNA topoisomerase [Gemmatimonadetes bacterium]|nr:type I DNA topoisomerase [Gemmatimonadota bacterium]
MRGALVVVESPAKARTINKILGKDFKVMASMGHVRDLPKKELGIDVANGFKPTYRTIRDRNKFVTELRAASRSAGRLILATDPDREGEAIAWHVAEALKRVNDAQRVMFNEITERAVREAVANPSEIDLRKVDAQQARRVLDRLVGYKVSPLLWKTIHGGLSAGRVQSVALRLICEREAAIEAFVPEEYWTVDAKVKRKDTLPFRARLVRLKGEKLALKDREEVDRILLDLRAAASDPGYRIADVKRQVQRRNPAPPFITSTLQQEASRRLRFTARKTMQVAQQLYEGIEVRSGTQSATETTGLITYMRTDSTRIASDAVSSARDYIRQRFGEAYLPVRARSYRKGKGAQDAHEAIRPTDMQRPPEVVQAQLTADQSKLYRLIWDRFIACQMSSAVFNRTAVEIRAGEYELRATGSVLKFAGFTALYAEGKDDDPEEAEARLPDGLKKGDVLTMMSLLPEQHFTKPPARFSEATLVRELESRAIGRPSTYAQIISTLQDRDYTARKSGRFVPTDLGRTVNGILVQAFPDVFNVDFTARMEDELDQVENGEAGWVKVVEDFYGPFATDLQRAEGQRKELKASLQEETDRICEKCGKVFVIKWGRNGRFLACSGFPECRNTHPLEASEAEPSGEVCEKCGSEMAIRTGRNGRFLACSGYPKCRNTRSISTGVPCPQEKCNGQLKERSSRRGRTFFGCGNFPECTYASWDRPLNLPCPMCEGPFLAEHAGRNGRTSLRCLKCRHAMPAPEEERA